MENEDLKFILNKKYLIKYDKTNVEIYEIISKVGIDIFFQFKSEITITSIQFNPLVDNIIILSLSNGTCKIYNILNKSEKEDILFESTKKKI